MCVDTPTERVQKSADRPLSIPENPRLSNATTATRLFLPPPSFQFAPLLRPLTAAG